MSKLCYGCFSPMEKEGVCPHCGYEAAAEASKYPTALKSGTILNGKYLLGRVLGQGGFGITYAAKNLESGTLTAIKEYLPEVLAGRDATGQVSAFGGQRTVDFENGKEGFLDEANALVDFKNNPYIVNIYDFFEENGTAYFVMEFVQGMSLKSYVKSMGGRLGEEEANRVLLPIMEALQEVHGKGLIHRDIAPDNIIVTAEGSAKLIDFGAARYSMGEKSQSLDVILKHGYAPKEQYARHGRQGPFTDVYAMAATYYYAVTGRVPPDAIDRIGEDSLIAPSSLGVKLSRNAEDALYKALEVQHSDRHQTMAEFMRHLQGFEKAVEAANKAQPKEEDPLLKRAAMFLRDGDWASADKYCERILDESPEKAEAYLYKLMAQLKVKEKAALGELSKSFSDNPNYRHAVEFAPPALKKQLQEYAEKAEQRAAEKKKSPVNIESIKANIKLPAKKSAEPAAKEKKPLKLPALNKKYLIMAGAVLLALVLTFVTVRVLDVTDGWEYNDGVLTISGEGLMREAVRGYERRIPWEKYRRDIYFVAVEDGITEVSADAFRDCVNLLEVSLPDSITFIGFHAFDGCTSLESIKLPAELTRIYYNAFNRCTSLKEIEFNDKLHTICSNAFYGCTGLEGKLVLPESVKTIESMAFGRCTGLSWVDLSKTEITSVSSSLFAACSGLVTVDIPGTVTRIGPYAFERCESFKTVYFHNTLEAWEAVDIDPKYNEALLNAKINTQ